jgi:hypothetical protein
MDAMSMRIDEEMLRTEIEFWRSMIESRRGTVSEQAIERMNNARALAERKLVLMDGDVPPVETRQ